MRPLAFVLLVVGVGCSNGGHVSDAPAGPVEGMAGNGGASANADEGDGEQGGEGNSLGGAAHAGVAGSNGGVPASEDAGSGGEGGTADELLPDEPDNGTRSGTRLKAEWYDFSGTRVFADFYDTELEAPCSPGPWSDGKVYCIPVSDAALGYAADSCKEADMLGHVSFNQACPAPSPGYLVLRADASKCSVATEHVYRLAATPTDLTQYWAPQNGGCAGPFSTGFNSDTFQVTGEVMASDLVEFTREPLTDPGKLSRQYISTADGARLAIAPHDGELDADCTLKPAHSDASQGFCPPSDSKDVNFFSDMGCRDGLVSAPAACSKPAFARQVVDRSCAQGASNYYRVADVTQPESVFVGTDTVCQSIKLSSGNKLYGLGDPAPVQALTRAPDHVAGKNLQQIYFSDGKKRFLDQRLYDTAHDTECQVDVQRDGTIVCVPFGSSVSAFYDDTCTEFIRVGLVYFGVGQCDAPALPPFLINPGIGGPGCAAGYEIRDRGTRFTGTPMLKGATTCDVYTGLDGYRFYEMGAVRPFSEFPTGTKTRDK